MEAKQRELTAREQAYFEHRDQAKEQGLTLTAYCQKVGLNVRRLYAARRALVEKGVVPRTLAPRTQQGRPSQFVAVHLAAPVASDPVCRVRHPSGWTIECGRWPEAAWVSQLLQGGEHAAA